jgi:hypothetical protein
MAVSAAASIRRISLANVASSRCVQPFRTLMYGPEKAGKTSALARAPKCIALDIEGRMGHVEVAKFPNITSWDEALEALETLIAEKHDYQNVLIDSVSALEKLLKLKVMADAKWDAAEAGEFQRWAKLANESYWPSFFALCERLEREKGMGILMTAHMVVKSMKNPDGEAYDRFRPDLCGDKGPQLFLHWCHDVLYATYQDMIMTVTKGGRSRVKTSTTGDRIMWTRHRPAFDAGNSCGLPEQMPLDFDLYMKLREDGLGPLSHQISRASRLIEQVRDPARRSGAKAFLEANNKDIGMVFQIIEQLYGIIDAQDKAEAVTPAQ